MGQFSVKITPLPGSLLSANQHADLLRELEKCRQGRIQQLRWAHACDSQRPRGRDDMRRNPAAQIDPLDFPEVVIRENSRKLQGLIEGR